MTRNGKKKYFQIKHKIRTNDDLWENNNKQKTECLPPTPSTTDHWIAKMFGMRERQLVQRFTFIEMSTTFQAQSTTSQCCDIAVIKHHRVLRTILYFRYGRLNQFLTIGMFNFNRTADS